MGGGLYHHKSGLLANNDVFSPKNPLMYISLFHDEN